MATRTEFTTEEERQIVQLYKDGWGLQRLCRRYHIWRQTLLDILAAWNVTVRPPCKNPVKRVLLKPEREAELLRDYWEEGYSARELTERYNISRTSVYRIVNRPGNRTIQGKRKRRPCKRPNRQPPPKIEEPTNAEFVKELEALRRPFPVPIGDKRLGEEMKAANMHVRPPSVFKPREVTTGQYVACKACGGEIEIGRVRWNAESRRDMDDTSECYSSGDTWIITPLSCGTCGTYWSGHTFNQADTF